MSPKPTIVLVPGAWATPAFHAHLSTSLSAKGLATEPTTHPSAGAEPPTKTLEDDVTHLRNTLERLVDAGKDVVVVAHSYGGLVSSGAVRDLEKPVRQRERKTGGVVMIVYVTAFVVNKGQSLVGGNYTTMAFEDAFHDLPREQQAQWHATLTHTSLPVFSGTATHEPWHVIPTAYIIGEEDQMLPLAVQEYMVGILGIGSERTYRLRSGHFAKLSMPGRVAGIVEELVGQVG